MSMKKLPSLEGLERIPHTALPEKLDEMFERIDKEDIAFVITEDGKDKYVLCPYAWFDFTNDENFGCMIASAIRNELNNPSENTEAVQRFVLNHYDSFTPSTLAAAINEIECYLRSEGKTHESMEGWIGTRNLLLERIIQEGHDKGEPAHV